jgi:hypothetical protein
MPPLTIPDRLIGASCPWRVVAPATLPQMARWLMLAETRPWVRTALAARAAALATLATGATS